MADILLINPKNIGALNFDSMPPLGLASIGCVLEQKGFSVKLLDLEITPENLDISAYISNCSPKVIGLSGTSMSRFESFKIANIAKKISSKINTVYGGCHATFTAEDTLSHISDIDYIVHGEGEMAFLELANFLILKEGTIETIKGISFKKEGKIIKNTSRERISNLDDLSYSRHLLEMKKYNTKLEFLNLPAISIMTSRGCPYNCNFCSASAMFGTVYTMRSAKHVVDEIEYCINNFNIKGIKFFDSTMTLEKKHVLAIAKEIKSRKITLPWECEIRVNTVDRPLLEAMKEAGCYYVNFGVESVSEKVLEAMGKNINIRQVIDTLKWCKELNIKTKVFFTFGHIKETWRDALKTIKFINEHFNDISKLAISYGIRIYPGTRLEKYARQTGLLPQSFSWSMPISTNIFSYDTIPILIQSNFGTREIEGIKEKIRWINLSRKSNFKEYFRKYRPQNIFNKLKDGKSFLDISAYALKRLLEICKVMIKILTRKRNNNLQRCLFW